MRLPLNVYITRKNLKIAKFQAQLILKLERDPQDLQKYNDIFSILLIIHYFLSLFSIIRRAFYENFIEIRIILTWLSQKVSEMMRKSTKNATKNVQF